MKRILIGGSPCFVAGTIIKTEDGYKDIENIKVGDKVLTHKGRYRTVKEVMKRTTDKTVLVKAENSGVIECTAEHPFYTKEVIGKYNTKKQSYDRVLSDEFHWTNPMSFYTNRNTSDTILQQTYLTSVTEQVFSPVDYSGVEIKVNQNTGKLFKSLPLDNENLWYIIGKWVSDERFDCCYEKGKHLSEIKIYCEKHEIDSFEEKAKAIGLHYTKTEEKTVFEITIFNIELAMYLQKFGNDVKYKHLPSEVYTLPKNLAIKFLEGYFNADEHIQEHISSFATINKELAYGIKYMINKYYETTCSIEINDIYTGVFYTHKQPQSHYFSYDGYINAPYESVTEINGEKVVYNLSVEDDESYTANGLVVHNCTHWSVAQSSKKRETTPEGIGWELFKNYAIAKEKFKPDFFLYENNKSAAQPIKDTISEVLGFPRIEINSALVSAQQRKRFYVCNWENTQPEDRHIYLPDIIDEKGAVCVAQRGRYKENSKETEQHFEARNDGKTNTLTTVQKDNNIAVPVIIQRGHGANNGGVKYDKTPCVTSRGSWQYNNQVILGPIRVGGFPDKDGNVLNSQGYRVYSTEGKSITLSANGGGLGAKTGLYAIAIGDTKETEYPIYEVKNGYITVYDVTYPIKLPDGFYIIRKLKPVEAERLQTLPDGYTEGIAETRRFQCIGNGWTAEVIIHLLSEGLKNVPRDEKIEVLSMYDGIATGRYCLEKMGFTNVRYYAYEIDEYAKKIANKNYPDIIQCGNAFDIRNDNWALPIIK